MIASHSVPANELRFDWYDKLQTWLVVEIHRSVVDSGSIQEILLFPHLVLIWTSLSKGYLFLFPRLNQQQKINSFLGSSPFSLLAYLLLTAVVSLIPLIINSLTVVKVNCSSPGCILSNNCTSSGCIWSRNSLWPCANKQVICQTTPKSLLCGASLNLHVLQEPFSIN